MFAYVTVRFSFSFLFVVTFFLFCCLEANLLFVTREKVAASVCAFCVPSFRGGFRVNSSNHAGQPRVKANKEKKRKKTCDAVRFSYRSIVKKNKTSGGGGVYPLHSDTTQRKLYKYV